MKRLISILAVLAVAATIAGAAMHERTVNVVLSGNGCTGGTNTIATVQGYIESIQVLCTDGASTGAVYVAVVSPEATVAALNIATNAVVASKLWRPRVDATDMLGADLTSDPPVRHFLISETVRMIVTDSPSNKTWRAYIKTNDQ